ncbi:plexin-C1-like [Perca fluviatilis]|uniref:plexin-C1-like n=1 Tax=Perca fluviatilis TaxID=8168 RepID=UPI0019623989|nr:plexin-C1-like [Perca fluviatilis]
MIVLPALLFILWGEEARCLEENGGFTFDGDLRHFAVATNTVYIATAETLYQLSHDLTLVQSLTQRGILKGGCQMDAQFSRVSETDERNATFSVNMLLPFVETETLISCGVIECGYCEVLDLKNISNVQYMENIQVGSPRRSSASIGFLVNVEETTTETYILTAIQQYEVKSTKSSCSTESEAVQLRNTNHKQYGTIFSEISEFSIDVIKRCPQGNAEFVDGFQISLTIYLFSNLPSSDTSNRVRLILAARAKQTKRRLSGRWGSDPHVDGGTTDTELLLFDISPPLTGDTDEDPDFCSVCSTDRIRLPPKTLKPKAVLFRQKSMTSVLAVRHKAWMVFFIGTGDGQLIKLAVDKNYHTTCPRVLYRATDDHQVFPKMHLDQVDLKHVYLPFRNQMKRVPVSKCSTSTNVQDCWSAQDPYCVWCGTKKSCTFEDDCQDSDWLSIPDDSQQKMVSYKVVKDDTGQITLNIQTHLSVGQKALSNFACKFSASSSKLCRDGLPQQFPQCTCILSNSTLPAGGLHVTVKIRVGTTQLSKALKLSNCSDIEGPPTSVL